MLRISVAPDWASSLAGGPGSQMSSQTVSPTRAAPACPQGDVDDRTGRARLEVALLVEHAVVGQVDLAVDRVDRPVGEDGGGVVDVLGALGEADDGDEPVRLAGQLAQRGGGVGEEVLLEQQVLGRVAGEGELGEQHQLGARVAGRAHSRADALGVAGDVADGGVHLAEGEAHAPDRIRAHSRARAQGASGLAVISSTPRPVPMLFVCHAHAPSFAIRAR